MPGVRLCPKAYIYLLQGLNLKGAYSDASAVTSKSDIEAMS
jgi:hypothetical protein